MESSDWQGFVAQCHQFEEVRDLGVFFDVFLTLSEKDELVKRFNIVKQLLQSNKTQREIARNLKVSIANVSRGANVIKTYPVNLKMLLQF